MLQGDSGGPVLWFDKVHSRWILAGLVSFGRECDIGFPGVNTQVSTFIDWIRDRIRGKHITLEKVLYYTNIYDIDRNQDSRNLFYFSDFFMCSTSSVERYI